MVALATFAGSVLAGPSQPDRKKAIQLFKKSQDAYQEGRFQDAADLLEEAYGLDPNPILLFNLARAKESTGDLEGTVAAYRRYLDADPNAKDRGAVERRIQNLEGQIAQRKELERKAEEERTRREALEKAPPPPPPPAQPLVPPPPTPPPPSSPSAVPWIILGVGAAGAGAGGILGAMASSKSKLAEEEPIQTTAADLDDAAHDLALGANLAFGIGGAVALTGLIWGIVDVVTSGETKAAVTVGPTASTSALGIFGQF